jgi:hypothetical protein
MGTGMRTKTLIAMRIPMNTRTHMAETTLKSGPC